MPNQHKIKEAFLKVKKDIFSLYTEISSLRTEIKEIKRILEQTDKPTDRQLPVLSTLNNPSISAAIQTNHSTLQAPTKIQQTQVQSETPTEDPKVKNFVISIGNEGVPTDRQTNQQTDTRALKFALIKDLPTLKKEDKISHIQKVSEIVNSLDSLKKDLRSIFKRLTPQEMQVYSTIYQLSDEGFTVDYPLLASKTSLSESSIRDYILKLTKKGAPLGKNKENNKRVVLSIPQDFKKVASLSTIISLREL